MYLPLDATRRSKNLSLTSVLSYTELYLSTSSWSLNLSKVSSVWIRFRNAAILSSLDNIIPQNVLAMRDQAEGATAIVQNVREDMREWLVAKMLQKIIEMFGVLVVKNMRMFLEFLSTRDFSHIFFRNFTIGLCPKMCSCIK